MHWDSLHPMTPTFTRTLVGARAFVAAVLPANRFRRARAADARIPLSLRDFSLAVDDELLSGSNPALRNPEHGPRPVPYVVV